MTKEQILRTVSSYSKIKLLSGAVDVHDNLRLVMPGLTEEQADRVLELREGFRLALVQYLCPEAPQDISESAQAMVNFMLRWCPPLKHAEFSQELDAMISCASRELFDTILFKDVHPKGEPQ